MTRDFAFIVPADVPSDTLVRAIRGADKAAIAGARLFDRFEAPEGLSLAFEVTLQPAEKSFTDEQIAEISKRIVAAAEKLGARLRSYLERVDRGVHARLDLLARQPGRDRVADLDVTVPLRWTNPRPHRRPLSSATGTTGSPSARYSAAKPDFSSGVSPTSTRVPSG